MICQQATVLEFMCTSAAMRKTGCKSAIQEAYWTAAVYMCVLPIWFHKSCEAGPVTLHLDVYIDLPELKPSLEQGSSDDC